MSIVQHSKAAREGFNMEETLLKLLARISELVRCDHVGLVLRDLHTEEIHIAAQWGIPADQNKLVELFSQQRGVIHQVFSSGRARIIGDTRRVPSYEGITNTGELNTAPMRSRVVVPLFIDGEISGALNVESAVPDAYSPNDLLMLNPLMDIVSLTVKTGRRHRELVDEHRSLEDAYSLLDDHNRAATRMSVELSETNQRLDKQVRRMITLHRIGETINSAMDQDKLLQYLADEIVRDFSFERSLIMLNQSDQLTTAAGAEAGKGESKPALRLSIRDDEARWAMLTVQRRAVLCSREGVGLITPLLNRLHLQRAVLVPMVSRGRLLGIMVAGIQQPDALTDADDLEVFGILSGYVVTALENLRLFKEAEGRAQEMEMLYRTANEIANQRDLPKLLQMITERAVKLLAAHSGVMYVFDRAHGRVEAVASYNIMPPLTGKTLNLGEGVAGRVATNRRPQRVSNYSRWPGQAPIYAGNNFSAVIGVPLLTRRGDLIGVLDVLDNAEKRVFSERDERLLTLFADQSSTVIETARLYADIRAANEQLIAASQMKSEFLATMSHELRTPLNSIIGYSDVLMQGVYGQPSEGQHKSLERIHHNAKDLLQLISDVLDVSKIEAGRFDLNSEPFSPRELANTTLAIIEPQAEEKGIARQLDVDPALPRQLMGDQQRLQQVLLNLLANAVKFTDIGSITIKLKLISPEWWSITVVDTGIGLEESSYRLIFDEFRQVDATTTRRYGGTGLGLAITRRLVTMMGGTIAVFSKGIGMGSTFTITLPLIEPKMQRTLLEADVWREETRRPDQVEWETVRIIGDKLKLPGGKVQLSEDEDNPMARIDELLMSDSALGIANDDEDNGGITRREVIDLVQASTSELNAAVLGQWSINPRASGQQPEHPPIIVVDDNASIRETLNTTLRAQGHSVVGAGSLAEAAAMINLTTPALILLNLSMPEGNSLEMITGLRAIERTSKVPIVLLSGGSNLVDEELARAIGRIDLVINRHKISRDEVNEVVKTALRQGEGR